ncbi:MAG TPA: hypothetical protein EYP67_05625 [Methanosarcinales archaeon]|nr:hypothetical protein [Methanosarcinales archaeon]
MIRWIVSIAAGVVLLLLVSMASATTVSIADSGARPGNTVTVPVQITDATKLGGCEINITYNSSIVCMTGVIPGDMELLAYNIDNESMRVYMNAINASGHNGDTVSAHLNLTATGMAWDVSPLNITVVSLFDTDYNRIPHTVQNGSFTVLPTSVATISIANATGIETIPITIIDGVNVGSVDIALTFNASVVNVTDVTGGDFDVTIPNLEHVHEGWVRIGAFQTDNPGLNRNITFANVVFEPVGSLGDTCSLNLNVITFKDATPQCNLMPYTVQNGTYTAAAKNGDVNGDGVVDMADAMYLAKHVLEIPGFEEIIEEAADVNDDTVIDIADAMYIAKHVLEIAGFEELM